jgi:hypothetical protein
LKEKKWECAEAVELTKWTRALTQHCDKLPTGAIANVLEAPLNDVLSSTNVLRHTAVHRLSTSARGIHKMIQSASKLANLQQFGLQWIHEEGSFETAREAGAWVLKLEGLRV